MNKRIILILISIMSKFLVSGEIPFNYTIVPGISLFRLNDKTNIATGTISSEVHSLDGVQLGPIYSISYGEANGVQASGIFNITGGPGSLVQLAGIMNISDSLDGVQFSGIINIAEDFNGVQSSGIINIADRGDGAQISGLINISDDFDGIQSAGLINIADRVEGLQLSGLINIADSGDVFQIGIINIVAEDSSEAVPLGVINLYENGIFDLSYWVDDSDRLYQSIKTGSKHLYTEFYTGSMELDFESMEDRVFGAALGFRSGTSTLHIDTTLGAMFQYEDSYDQLWIPEVKSQLGLSLGSLSLFAGVSGKFAIVDYSDNVEFLSNSRYIEVNDYVDIYANLFAGISLEL